MFPTYREALAWESIFSTVVYIEVRKPPDGDLDIGTGFHIGSGFFVTARHVIEGNEITKIGQSDLSLKTSINPDGSPYRQSTHPEFEVSGKATKRFLHHDSSVDVALVRVEADLGARGFSSQLQPAIPLAEHADILTEGELLMTAVKVFGFPAIPYAVNERPPLVVASGEISAVIKSSIDKRRHFIVSATARGGFSGGPIILTGNPTVEASAQAIRNNSCTVVGVVSNRLEFKQSNENEKESLDNAALFQPGFLDATTIQAVYEIISDNGLSGCISL